MSPLARLLLTTSLAAGCSLPGRSPAETDFNQVGRAVAEILANRHFSRQPLNAEFDAKFVNYLLGQLDPNKMYLLQEDVDWVAQEYGQNLHEAVLGGRTMAVAEPIYRRFRQRVADRHAWVDQQLASQEFDLNRPEASYQIKRKEADWPANAAAADELWTARLTDELILETLRRRLAAERRAKAAGTATEPKKVSTDASPAPASPETPTPDTQSVSEATPPSASAPAAGNGLSAAAVTPADAVENAAPGSPQAAEATKPDAPAGAAPTDPAASPDAGAALEGAVENSQSPPIPPGAPQPEGEAVPQAPEEETSPAETLRRRYHRVSEDFGNLSNEDIADLFLSNLATSFDPHTDYMSYTEHENFMQSMRNNLIGIGALLSAEDDGTTRIEGIVVDGPADQQGELKIDDRVIGVDPKNDGNMVDTMFMRLDRVVELVRGEAGSKVRLKVHPAEAPDDVREIVITRNQVELKSQLASADLYQFGSGEDSVRIGWIIIPSFYGALENSESSITRDVEALLRRLMAERADGIVLDLRMNGGGVLEEAVKLTGLFMPRGPVVQIADPFGDREELRSFSRQPLYRGPLAVVTNRLSASASEIVAGALQDHHRAVIIGDDRTFGKGTVQRVIDVQRQMPLFSDRRRAGSIKVTEQKFYRPSGVSTQLDGVASDIVVPSVVSAYDIGEAAEINPLPNDAIAASEFTPLPAAALFLEQLKADSLARIAENPQFRFVQEDIASVKEDEERLSVVLDLETRYQQIQEQEAERVARNGTLRDLFQTIEEQDKVNIQGWHFDMENVVDPQLHALSEFGEDEHMRRAVDEDEELLATPEFPNDLDPVERESLAVVRDLIRLQSQAPAIVSNRETQPAEAEAAR